MFSFIKILDQLPKKLTIVDVGAASMGKDTDNYYKLIDYPHVQLIGFEPNNLACESLNNNSKNNFHYFPYFIGDGADRTFYECPNPLNSSLYKPDADVLEKFQRMDIPVINTENVKTVRLDDIDEINDIDYIKLDVQGAELDVINGGKNKTKNAVIVDTEVEFIPIYKDQPVFGDIDVSLRSIDFQFVNFIKIFSRQMRPFILNDNLYSDGSQLMFAESAVYMKNMMNWQNLPDEKIINLATILHDVYGYFDICTAILDVLEKRTGTPFVAKYANGFTQPD